MWNVKRMLLAIVVLFTASIFLCPTESPAVSANPVLHTLTQPDGTAFKARQWGDEHLSGWETEDGYTILYAEATQTWYFAELDTSGKLVSSIYQAGLDQPLPGIPGHLRPKLPPDTSSESKTLSKTLALPGSPPTGTRNIPVILVNFADTNPTYDKNDFTNLLFGSNTFSMKDYFREVSYNKFNISAGVSGVVGWVTASRNRNYYGWDESSGAKDYWVADLVYESVRQSDSQVNFADYDSNGDCLVDNVMIVHQGRGQESSPDSNDI